MNIVVLAGIVITIATAIPVFLEMRKHPKGLHILFFAEMWERFSYYGMRGLLIFYLTQHFLFSDSEASSQYGAYTALVYLLPLLGGYLADRYLGNRKAIAFGALLLVAGHATMGIEGEPAREALIYEGQQYELVAEGRGSNRSVMIEVDGAEYSFSANSEGDFEIAELPSTASIPAVLPQGQFEIERVERDRMFLNIFYFALALIIMGVGFLKANISSIVGQLYEENDPRRDGGFTLYYYGINLGSFWAAILCGLLGETVGWWAGFGLAGLGMALGWVVFVRGRALFFLPGKNLIDHVGNPPSQEKLKAKALGPINTEWLIYGIGLVGVVVVWFMVQAHTIRFTVPGMGEQDLLALFLLIGGLGFLSYVVFYMVNSCTKVEAQRLILALILIIVSVVFWALFEQAGSSMNLFAARNTDLSVGPFEITASQTQSFNAGFILLFAPVFAAIWAFLAKLRKNPNTPLKFALALVQVGLGFMLLVWGTQFAGDDYRVPLIFLAGAYLLHTTGELCLSPVGLSAITKLSPGAVVSTMMAGWFLSSAFAQYVAGIIATFTATDTVAGQVLDPAAALNGYAAVFGSIGLFAIVLGVIFGVLSFWLKGLGHGRAVDQIDAKAEAAGPDQDARDLV
ncbi:MAG: MFS transporter [Oceanicaulis sp.]|uniref:peptide MFS transporter n=1 Tax=unclassified Oceanicaulis TaxID=2632123 RepID=UPI000C6BA8C8|nr:MULTISPECIES: peptide MFS transporter [unclassified Oceanicaulis]MBC39523.1 MFS transporter [Oceanicaulis sp.]HBU62099.1 MFS transporter [Oceanicaulis sp.]|tara:strand:- start:197 stop:2077 length:1881 start_codon:yes stop_codon:yes gene_type:complete